MKKIMNNSGFTLVELLAVIAILSLLVLFAVPKYFNDVENASELQVRSDIKVAEQELSLYLLEHKTIKKAVIKGEEVGFNKYILPYSNYPLYTKSGDIITKENVTLFAVSEVVDSTLKSQGVFLTENGREVFFAFLESPEIGLVDEKIKVPVTNPNKFKWVELEPKEVGGYTFPGKNGSGYWKYTGKEKVVSIPDKIDGVTLDNYYKMFSETNVERVISTNTSVKRMGNMFRDLKSNKLDVSELNTDSVTDMNFMFRGNNVVNLDLSDLYTGKVTNMNYMFSESKSESINLEGFDTSKVKAMTGMFNLSKAAILDVSSFDTSQVTSMNYMFSGAKAMDLNLGHFSTQNVSNFESMFYNSSAKTINVSNFITNKASNMKSMFSKSSAKELDLSSFTFKNSSLVNYEKMFGEAISTKVLVENSEDVKTLSGAPINKPTTLSIIHN